MARETEGAVALTQVDGPEFERCRRAVLDNCREGWIEALPSGLGGVEVVDVRRIENTWVAAKFNATAGFNSNTDSDAARGSMNDIAAASAAATGGGAPLKVGQ